MDVQKNVVFVFEDHKTARKFSDLLRKLVDVWFILDSFNYGKVHVIRPTDEQIAIIKAYLDDHDIEYEIE